MPEQHGGNLRGEERRVIAAAFEGVGLHHPPGCRRTIEATLSREAGMYTAHEMMESLDPNHHSEIAESLMAECERLLDSISLPPTPAYR